MLTVFPQAYEETGDCTDSGKASLRRKRNEILVVAPAFDCPPHLNKFTGQRITWRTAPHPACDSHRQIFKKR